MNEGFGGAAVAEEAVLGRVLPAAAPGFGVSRASSAGQPRAAVRTAVVASGDADLRERIAEELRKARWQVRQAGGGAEALARLDEEPAEALLVDGWLPDLVVSEFVVDVRRAFPELEVFRLSGGFVELDRPSPRRNEILLAVRAADGEGSASPVRSGELGETCVACGGAELGEQQPVGAPVPAERSGAAESAREPARVSPEQARASAAPARMALPRSSVAAARPLTSTMVREGSGAAALPEMIGDSAAMRELAWLIRLVSPRATPVLIEGATGTGKELVAKAVHRLSARAGKPYVVLNCAAIPESLLEAELFGHTRGAFTGAVQSRVGRVEAANGGTLFLDEIGEMPIGLQAKMLRFLEYGEIQRVGGNETMRVDVRIVAATHQPLKQRTGESAFRLDLYHRLAVFPVRVPALQERMEDVPLLARFFLAQMGQDMPVKRLSAAAQRRLMEYDWPGNVRELAHVLERATILAEDRWEIREEEIRF